MTHINDKHPFSLALKYCQVAFPWVNREIDIQFHSQTAFRIWLTPEVALFFLAPAKGFINACFQFKFENEAPKNGKLLESDDSDVGIMALVGAVSKSIETSKAPWALAKSFKAYVPTNHYTEGLPWGKTGEVSTVNACRTTVLTNGNWLNLVPDRFRKQLRVGDFERHEALDWNILEAMTSCRNALKAENP